MGIDTKANTLWGGGAPQVGDLRLLEDGGERSGALGSDFVVPETADEGRSGDGERVASMSMGPDKKANTLWGGGALQVCDLRLAEDGGECSGALVSNAIQHETARDGWGHSERAGAYQRALTEKQTLGRWRTSGW